MLIIIIICCYTISQFQLITEQTQSVSPPIHNIKSITTEKQMIPTEQSQQKSKPQQSLTSLTLDHACLSSTIGEPKHSHYLEIGENTNKWLTGIGSQSPLWINASQSCSPVEKLMVELFVTEQYGDWESYKLITITDNSDQDTNPINGSISYQFFLNESFIYQIHYWAYDMLNIRIPAAENSYEELECVVDAIPPESQVNYQGPYYHDTNHWLTSKSYIIIKCTDSGFYSEGSGVKKIHWWIEKKINNNWIKINESIIFDNHYNDTDGTPAHPSSEEAGGIYAFDAVGWPYIFEDNGDYNWTYDVNDTLLYTDPDHDGNYAVPLYGHEGGLFSFDTYREPFLFKDFNRNWQLDYFELTFVENNKFKWLDVDNDDIHSYPKLGTQGGLFAFDNISEAYTFIDHDNNSKYNPTTDKLIDVNAYNDGPLKTITIQLNLSSDGIYRVYHQGSDHLGNIGPIQKQLIKVDNTPPKTRSFIGQPRCHYYKNEDEDWFGVTTHTDISLTSSDLLPKTNVGVEHLHYEIWLDSTNDGNFSDLITSNDDYWADSTFSFTEECKHQLRYYATDKLGNIETKEIINFTVDDQKPEIIIDIDTPSVTGTGEPDYWITEKTNITINALNKGCCPCLNVKYRINNEPWITITNHIPYNITLPDDKRYEIEVKATDYLQTQTREMIFYGDNTPPEMHILDPVNSEWYSDGSEITTVTYAVDIPNTNPHCDAIGIPEDSHPNAYLINVFPSFSIIELNTDECYYQPASHEYIGTVKIPEDTVIPDGMVLFIFEAKDGLGNGMNNIIELLSDFYQNSQGDSDLFNQSIQSYIGLQKIIRLGIDNTAPQIVINQPSTLQTVGPETVAVNANINDSLAGIDPLKPCHVYFYGEVYYLGSIPFINGIIDGSISFPADLILEDNEEIPLKLKIADRAGNIATNSVLVNYENPYVIPQVSITTPTNNEIITEENITVTIDVDSTEQPNDLEVYLWVNNENDPAFGYEATYNSSLSIFEVILDVSEYQNNTQLSLHAEAIDQEDTTGISSTITIIIQNSIRFDKFLNMNTNGWNPITLTVLENYTGFCPVDQVFCSIIDNITIILEQGTWKNFIPNQGGNTLTEIDPTKTYWVKMKQPDRLFIDQNNPPCS